MMQLAVVEWGKNMRGETILSKNIPQIKENRKGTYELDETYCRHDIPKPFIYALLPMTSNPKKINIFWSKVELAYKRADY